MQKVKIMIINDSKAMRFFLEESIKEYGDCEVIGSHSDGSIALNYLKLKKPDVIILDLEMPHVDGLTFLERISHNEKFPVIVVSNYCKDGTELVNDAMDLGAVDSIMPPSSNTKEAYERFRMVLHHKIIKASLKSSRFILKNSCQQ